MTEQNNFPFVIKAYYALTKPGIIYGNALTAIGGYFLAAHGHGSLGGFLGMLVGICLVMACGCVFNNYLDRDIDKLMKRTKNRALVTGEISPRNALIFGTVLGAVGLALLGLANNGLSAGLGALGIFFYVVVYGIGKRRSEHGTLIGSISGAIPPVVGYAAYAGTLDLGALLLFLILATWQMPHFYAIALYRQNDYADAKIPVLPIKKGAYATKVQILAYVIAFAVACWQLQAQGYAGNAYLITMTALNLAWLAMAAKGFSNPSVIPWAKRLFRFSLIILTVFCILLCVDVFLP